MEERRPHAPQAEDVSVSAVPSLRAAEKSPVARTSPLSMDIRAARAPPRHLQYGAAAAPVPAKQSHATTPHSNGRTQPQPSAGIKRPASPAAAAPHKKQATEAAQQTGQSGLLELHSAQRQSVIINAAYESETAAPSVTH